MSAIEDIAAERKRQIEVEGWTAKHDDEHTDGELAGAAACYAMHDVNVENRALKTDVKRMVRDLWPWASHWWKPKERRHNLVRAGALIVAEIERLDRAGKVSP